VISDRYTLSTPETEEQRHERIARQISRNYRAHNAWLTAETRRIFTEFRERGSARP
jgi:hypothetical protein